MKKLILFASLLFSFSAYADSQGLMNSVWAGGSSNGGDSVYTTYLFRFGDTNLELEATCHSDSISSTMKSSSHVSYSNDRSTATLTTGISLQLPAGHDTCEVNFPGDLKFHLENEKVFLEYKGSRRPTSLKRL